MRDVLTVLRKEVLEILGNRHSLRGPLVQGAIVFLLTGVIVPRSASMWSDPVAPVLLLQLFPAAIASMIAADAFAGERERRTLETLLATPASEMAIFLGKTLCAVSVALLVSCASLISALLVANLHLGPTSLSPAAGLSVILGSVAAALFTSSLAVAISSRVDVARSAQQMASMAAIAFVFGGATLLRQVESLTPSKLLGIDAVVTGVALTILALSTRGFRRTRLFDQ
ncbi:MAG: ABC transporter permease [Vicinamibacteria bacterium]|nr:ABC transporter permease [Vicinamibacteria bacterium]